MTATPIPRWLALAQYGDMDVSVLDEKPPGRQPVETALVSAGRISEVIEHLRRAIAEGRQAYWVCPLVGEFEVAEMTAAEERFDAPPRSRSATACRPGPRPDAAGEKDAAMADFVAGRTRLLVATTVIEVGVNVPNASIMVIEGAQAFGLAQLHQLRGRVGPRRGTLDLPPALRPAARRHRAARGSRSCAPPRTASASPRRICALRGAGDLIGVQQSGLPRFRIADLEPQADLMRMAQDDSRLLLDQDPSSTRPRGQAMRTLLYLMERDKAIRMLPWVSRSLKGSRSVHAPT